MAVTKPRNFRKLKHLAVMLPASALMIVSFQNCAVDMSAGTPGAASENCAPTQIQLDEFEIVLNNTLQATGSLAGGKQACGACHNINSGNSANASYTVFPGNTAATPALVTQNFCATMAIGSGMRHATTPMHGGGLYSQSDIPALYTWMQNNL